MYRLSTDSNDVADLLGASDVGAVPSPFEEDESQSQSFLTTNGETNPAAVAASTDVLIG